MHVFCDESGGVAPDFSHFTVAVAAVEQHAAVRVVKRFRKAARLKGEEVKGSSLSPDHRKLFVKVLIDEGCGPSAAVVCVRGDRVADWALRKWLEREHILYRHMLVEALGFLDIGFRSWGVTADRGRYTKAVPAQVAAGVTADLERLTGRRVPFTYMESVNSPGVQIADVLCNTAGKLLAGGPQQQDVAAEALAPLLKPNLLVVRSAELPGIAPVWLRTAEVVETAP